MGNFIVKDPPEYSQEMKRLETTDPAHADVFNKLLEKLLNNDAFLKGITDLAEKHMKDGVIHVTLQDKQEWDAKAGTAEATQEKAGLESPADKKKLDEIEEKAEVNQNAFSGVTVGTITIEANGKTATFTLEAGDNITLTADNASKKINIKATRDGGNADMVDGYHAAHFAAADHGHDGRYYTKTESNNLLAQKAASSHSHSKSAITDFPTSMPPTAHTHDDRYYTETEVNNFLANKAASTVVDSGDYNNMKTPGLYTMRTITANSPDGGSYFGLLVLKSDNGNYVEQLAIKESSGNVYVRYLAGDTWSAWKQLVDGSIYKNDGVSLERTGSVGARSVALGAYSVEASGPNSFATGWQTIASGDTSVVFGYANKSSATRSFVWGHGNEVTGRESTANGYKNKVSGVLSYASGEENKVTGGLSFTVGKFNYARDTNPEECQNDLFIVGNGSSDTVRSNAFRINYGGYVYCKSSYGSGGADYAEYFEWEDGNSDHADRIGHFVALEQGRIRIAEPGDYVLGVVSAFPCLIGNSDEEWQGRWKRDIFGRLIWKEVQVPITRMEEITEPILDKEGKETGEVKVVGMHEVMTGEYRTERQLEQVEGYDPTKTYIERRERPEWAPIGMLGVLAVYDDGSCEVNGYCKVADGGIATAADGEYMLADGKIVRGYRVIERVADNIVKVIFR